VLLNAGNIVRAQLRTYATFAPTQLYLPGLRFLAPNLVRSGPLKEAQQAFFDGLAAAKIPRPKSTWPSRGIRAASSSTFYAIWTGATAAQVKDAIEATHGISGINSLLDYRDMSQRGVPIGAVVVIRWNGAQDRFDPVSQPGGLR